MVFSTRIEVRGYELDSLGHLNHAVYHQYAEVSRMKAFVEAGCEWEEMVRRRIGPVLLSTTVNFRSELRGYDVVDVSCAAKFGTGKTFTLDQEIVKVDGTLAAEVYGVFGVMNLDARKLFPDPRAALESAGLDISVLLAD